MRFDLNFLLLGGNHIPGFFFAVLPGSNLEDEALPVVSTGDPSFWLGCLPGSPGGSMAHSPDAHLGV